MSGLRHIAGQIIYLMKLDKTLMYASTKQAITEIMNEMFSKQNSEYQIQ